jgi:DNA-directed RNA polymerase specialized sigma subunit
LEKKQQDEITSLQKEIKKQIQVTKQLVQKMKAGKVKNIDVNKLATFTKSLDQAQKKFQQYNQAIVSKQNAYQAAKKEKDIEKALQALQGITNIQKQIIDLYHQLELNLKIE